MWLFGFLNAIYFLIVSYTPLIAFLGTFFFGGETAALLGFGATRGDYSVLLVLIFGFLGIVTSDVCWYAVGRYSLLRFFKRYHFVHVYSEKTKNLLHKFYLRKRRLMFFSRFIYGTAIATFIYLGKRMKFSEFIFYEFFISLFWIFFYVGIGWYAGRGFGIVLIIYNNIWVLGFAVIFLLLGLMMINFLLNRLFMEWVNKKQR